ncbi:MAG TPA: hypothetical protein VK014_07950 [Cyclobacteriaceae bacterium]|nr:hypothetical protein [Cyclobacteriaceae bacterium]
MKYPLPHLEPHEPLRMSPSLIGTSSLEIRLTSVEIGTPTLGFGTPNFDLLFPILQFKNQKFGIGWDNPDHYCTKIYFRSSKRGTSDEGRGTSEPHVSGSELEISRSEAQIRVPELKCSDLLAEISAAKL